jgi:capsule polysaccharide export protein KpsE/RkpR
VIDRSPQQAAEMANQFVEELRLLTSRLALSEAQQRRVLFEGQLKQTRDQLTAAQQALQASGFSQSALRADARASAEGYARLRAEVTSAEVRLQALRRNLSDNTPEVQQALSIVGALRAQLGKLEGSADLAGGPDYVSKFREFKYQETLFDLLARQYELARVDEAQEGMLIQVVDEARPAEHKHGPKRALIALVGAAAGLVLAVAALLVQRSWQAMKSRAAAAATLDQPPPAARY